MDAAKVYQITEQLFDTRWKLSELERLWDFLYKYEQTPLDQAERDSRHLDFIRWLVSTGKLTGDTCQ